MIRVAYVVHSFDVGGLERCATHLANELDSTQFQPLIISLTNIGRAKQWLHDDRVPVHALHKPPGNDRQVCSRLARLLIDEDIDIVHSHNWGTLLETVLAVRTARRQGAEGIRHIHAEHGLELDRYRTSGIRRLVRQAIMAWCFRQCDKTVAIAHCVSRWMHRLCWVPRSKHYLVPNGVVAPMGKGEQERLRDELGIDRGAFVLGSVGRVVEMKGFDVAVDAIQSLVASGVDAHWILAGDGPELPRLEERACEAEVERRVHLLGARSDLGCVMQSIDALLNTSHTEAMNLAILEAMACGRPVIATNVGDNEILIGCETDQGGGAAGESFAPGDVQALCTIVKRWVASPEVVQRCAAKAQDRYDQRYQLSRMIEAYAKLYREALGVASAN